MFTMGGEEVRERERVCVCVCVQVGVGDCVTACPEDEAEAVYIAQVVSLWEDSSSTQHRKQFHARWFRRSSETPPPPPSLFSLSE